MSASAPLFMGVDIGTSGVRAVIVDGDATGIATGQAKLKEFEGSHSDPKVWLQAFDRAISQALASVDLTRIVSLAIDGTSGTVLPVSATGKVLAEPLMYNDPSPNADYIDLISRHAPSTSAAHGATSGLAKALYFQETTDPAHIIHQADWLAGQLTGRFDLSDENNALKTGYDPVARLWPAWMDATGINRALLPQVLPAGSPMARITASAAAKYGLPGNLLIIAGTTDGCASFLATGAKEPGDGVTALGTTLTVKLLSDKPLFAPQYGLYSHRIGDMWLAGGASNTGGAVLTAHFLDDQILDLSAKIDSTKPTGLNYYPLVKPGERFPINDPNLAPRMTPRPDDDALFLQAIFEGIAGVEALSYERLSELGAPTLRSVRTVGGGAKNAVWSTIRKNRLVVDLVAADSEEAAAGSARLAIMGARTAGFLA